MWELLGDNGRCGLIFASWEKFIAHQTHNKGGNHGIKSPLRVAVSMNQGVSCGSTFADRPTAQNRVVNSWTRGTCRTDHSRMTWSPEEVTQPISCNFCAQEFGDLQTYCVHARLTHLPFPAPTIRVSRHAQPVRQPRRNRQHARNGHERRRSGRTGATTPKAAPTNLKQNQGRRRSHRTDDGGGHTQSRRQVRAEEPQRNHAQGHPLDASDDARLVIDGMGHSPE